MAGGSFSGSQLDKLGDRLRVGPLTLSDLQRLRTFLEELEPFAERHYSKIRDLDAEAAGLMPAQITRRNVKTIRSIVAKLRRQTTKLAQIQDLVGCRIVARDTIDQSEWLRTLVKLFPGTQVIDRSITEKNGYRAKHLIVREPLGRFEIQLRSYLQDRWSNVVEKIADRHGLEIKYGGGEPRIQQQLLELAKDIAKVEEWESVCQVRPESWPLDGTHGMRFELVREGVVLRDAGSLSAAQQMQQNIDRLTWKPDLQLRSFRAIAPGSIVRLGSETDVRSSRATVGRLHFSPGDHEGVQEYFYALDLQQERALPDMISGAELDELRSDISGRIDAIEEIFS